MNSYTSPHLYNRAAKRAHAQKHTHQPRIRIDVNITRGAHGIRLRPHQVRYRCQYDRARTIDEAFARTVNARKMRYAPEQHITKQENDLLITNFYTPLQNLQDKEVIIIPPSPPPPLSFGPGKTEGNFAPDRGKGTKRIRDPVDFETPVSDDIREAINCVKMPSMETDEPLLPEQDKSAPLSRPDDETPHVQTSVMVNINNDSELGSADS